MSPVKMDLMTALIEEQPITPEIARNIENVGNAFQESMRTISHAIVAYFELPWYNPTGATSRNRILNENHELFRHLAFLDHELRNCYVEKGTPYVEAAPVASSSGQAGKGRAEGKDELVSKHRPLFPPPHWDVVKQKSTSKKRQFAMLLHSQSSTTSAAQIEKV